MLVHPAMRQIRSLLTLLWFLFLMPAIVIAQKSATEVAVKEQPQSSGEIPELQVDMDARQEIDEITVVAPRSVVVIQRQIERADIAMYEIANTLIDDPMYKVYCRLESFAGTRLKQRVCQPAFESRLMEAAWEDERMMGRMGEGNYTFSYDLPKAEVREYREKLKQKLIELAADNPNLADAIYKRAQLQRDYELARSKVRQVDD